MGVKHHTINKDRYFLNLICVFLELIYQLQLASIYEWKTRQSLVETTRSGRHSSNFNLIAYALPR